ncbi:unnamed protein product [Mytilus edulis]|uniref:B box-type domain-containing protein n=1 Tax=Mytilus edulis TaxID=6550 RepID=A0A8S3R490_MYTED|nr:unnamed protein product [Mytilus edulis]
MEQKLSRCKVSAAVIFNSSEYFETTPNSTDYILKEKIADENGRYLILTVEIDNTDFVFVNYYAPTKNFENDQIEYIEKLKILLNEKLDQNLVLGGDFNTILNPSLDKMGGSKYNTPVKYTSKLEDFIEEFDLCDIWRTKNVDSRLYTWRQRTPLIQCRLDFWLISNFLSSSVTKTSIVPSIKSDHSLIKLTLSGENFSERGPGFWKFNSGLLTDKDYVDIVKNTLSECDDKYQNLENKNLKWDTIKSEIRGATVKYSKYKNMKLRERESNLKKRQDEIHKNLSRTYLDKDINTLLIELDIVKEDLEQIVNNQTRGAIIRSHAEHCEGNERNSKYFLSLEKRNYKNKCINKLVVNDIEILSQEKILYEERNFYEKLYSSKEDPDKYSGDSNFFDLNFIPKLTDLEKDICDADISESECVKVLKTFKNNKSPETRNKPGSLFISCKQNGGTVFGMFRQMELSEGMLTLSQLRVYIMRRQTYQKKRNHRFTFPSIYNHPTCDLHYISYESVCLSCGVLVCTDCLRGIHRKHRIKSVRSVADEQLQLVQNELQTFKRSATETEEQLKLRETHIHDFYCKARSMEKELKNDAERIDTLIFERRQQLLFIDKPELNENLRIILKENRSLKHSLKTNKVIIKALSRLIESRSDPCKFIESYAIYRDILDNCGKLPRSVNDDFLQELKINYFKHTEEEINAVLPVISFG